MENHASNTKHINPVARHPPLEEMKDTYSQKHIQSLSQSYILIASARKKHTQTCNLKTNFNPDLIFSPFSNVRCSDLALPIVCAAIRKIRLLGVSSSLLSVLVISACFLRLLDGVGKRGKWTARKVVVLPRPWT